MVARIFNNPNVHDLISMGYVVHLFFKIILTDEQDSLINDMNKQSKHWCKAKHYQSHVNYN